jgi:hypothetical protein
MTGTNKTVKNYGLFTGVSTIVLLIYFMTGQFSDILRLSIIYFGFVTLALKLAQNQRMFLKLGRAKQC